jgi:uncharacterized protein
MGPVNPDRKAIPGAVLGRRLDPVWLSVVKHPWRFIALILFLTVALGAFLPNLKIDPSLESLVVDDSSARISYRKFLDQYGSDEFLVMAARANNGDLFTQENLAAIKATAEDLAELPMVREVISPATAPIMRPTDDGVQIGPLYEVAPTDLAELAALKALATTSPLMRNTIVSADGASCVWFAFPNLRKEDTTKVRMDLYYSARAIAEEHLQNFEVHFEGIPTVKAVMVEYIVYALTLFSGASAILIGLVLFFTFSSIRGVVIPAAVVWLATIWALGVMGATGGVVDTISSIILVLIVVVGVGDTVHILVQYFEEYYRLQEKDQALLETMRKLFAPCLLTSVTTAIGFMSLVAIPIPPIRRFGLYAAFGVLAAFVVSFLLAPAILKLMAPPTKKYGTRFGSGFLHRRLTALGDFNVKRRRAILVGAAVLLVFSVVGISQVRVETRVTEFFHPWSPIVKGYEFLAENLTPPVPMEIVLEGEPGAFYEPENWQAVEELSEQILTIPKVHYTDSYLAVLKEMQWAFSGGGPRTPANWKLPDSRPAIAQYSLLFQMDGADAAERLVSEDFSQVHLSIRMEDITSSELIEVAHQIEALARVHVPAGIKYEITGNTMIFTQVVEALVGGQVRSLTMALLIITFLIALLFRSVKIGLLSMIPNVLPILVMLGLMGWLGFALDTNTVMIGPITIGIAVDDTIHYITRYRRELKVDGSSVEAMKRTLTSTGRALVSTSMILAFGFSITVLSPFRPQSVMGGLGAFTILVALVADLVLLPAVILTLVKMKARREA